MSRIMASTTRGIAIISLCLCSLTQVHAEEAHDRSAVLRFGGFLGGGFVDWVGKDANKGLPGEERVPKSGLSAGLLAALDLSAWLSLGIEPFHLAAQSELVYAQKGSKIEIDGEDIGASTNMTYWQAGLLIRAEYDISERVTPYVLAGPELGFLREVLFERRSRDPVSTKHNYKSTDLGLVVGVGSLLSFPPWGAASLELRADLGLVSISDTGYGNEVRNAALLLLLGYLY